MESIRRRLPGPGVVLAVVALVAALAGTAVALPGKNTVNSRDIKANAVKAQDIAANAVRGEEVREATLGTVPDARRANTAAHADRATRADTAASADALGGKSAVQLDTRWALINEAGDIERQTGGFAIVDCYQTNANCYISAGEDVRDNGLQAQIAVANTDGSAILSAEAGTAPVARRSSLVLLQTPRATKFSWSRHARPMGWCRAASRHPRQRTRRASTFS